MGKLGSLKLKSKTDLSTKVSKPVNNAGNKSAILKPLQLQSKKTPAQLAFEAAQQKKQKEKLPILAAKSHKEKVAEFNEHLGRLSEHHDIPKVGPG